MSLKVTFVLFVYGSLIGYKPGKNTVVPGYTLVKKSDREAVGAVKTDYPHDGIRGELQEWNIKELPYLFRREGVPFHYYPWIVKTNMGEYALMFRLRKRYIRQ
jgi:hypothetical protein